MSARRSALGRGLDALLPGSPSTSPRPEATGKSAPASATRTPAPSEPAEGETPATGSGRIAVSAIQPNPDQPRRRFDPEALDRLADSLRRHGVLQPVVVREIEGSEPRRYELVVGERRWRAAQKAGLDEIPATIQDVAPKALLEVALVENVQRRDLNPIELAHAFRELIGAGMTQEEVGRRVGLDRSSVSNHLRLLDLDSDLQADVESGTLSSGHAKALLQLQAPERRQSLRDRIVEGGLSVRAAEDLARTLAGTRRPERRPPKPAAEPEDPNLRSLLDSLRETLQTKVRIQGDGRKGKLEIEFYGPEELHRITRAILEGPDAR
ncbi:MAG: ParB/RepB/Spo0J family partition protein [Myxococcota bacterium]|nr:ParB/RepB/Spo0J family partition protein [Myxococcota bacterium]